MYVAKHRTKPFGPACRSLFELNIKKFVHLKNKKWGDRRET